ncbi:uncharacterized protein LTR77_001324 [Saxophila tyrrhenica]|uniref:Uncharacterized protein n=1 Tax=Saxophila tyrrhenica TaxID=1690608 RepID=A0AAV9PPN4_9PEZI|nr:hypothetical protein LTR77_001324 [Saxophila tyrrhenica]
MVRNDWLSSSWHPSAHLSAALNTREYAGNLEGLYRCFALLGSSDDEASLNSFSWENGHEGSGVTVHDPIKAEPAWRRTQMYIQLAHAKHVVGPEILEEASGIAEGV